MKKMKKFLRKIVKSFAFDTIYLYKDYNNIIEKTPEFLKEHEHLLSITTNANSDKMYL